MHRSFLSGTPFLLRAVPDLLHTPLAVLSPPIRSGVRQLNPAVFLPGCAPVFQIPETVLVVTLLMLAGRGHTPGAVPGRGG